MTNRIAIWLLLIIVLIFLTDHYFFEGHLPVFLGRKFSELIEYIAFWR